MTAPTTDFATQGFRDQLLAFILSRVRSREIAEDLAQETLLKAARSLGRSHVGNLQAWLFRVASNTVADHFRGSRDQVEWREDAHGETTSEGALTVEEGVLRQVVADYVRGVVNELREPYREALLLTEYEGLSQPELARRLGISLTCAKSRVQRARAEVKRTIEQCCRIATDTYGQVTDCVPNQRSCCDC